MSTPLPATLRYAKSHEWLLLPEPSGQGTVGITDHAQRELTDIVFVELPAVGRVLKAGEACAVVESVKTASDIYAPISGEVIEVNQSLVSNPGLINDDPFGKGWFFKLRPSHPAEAGALLSADDYQKLIGG